MYMKVVKKPINANESRYPVVTGFKCLKIRYFCNNTGSYIYFGPALNGNFLHMYRQFSKSFFTKKGSGASECLYLMVF